MMDRSEFREGLKAFRALLEGMERIVADPAAIERMKRRAEENPSLLLGPTVVEYLGLDSPTYGGEEAPTDSEEF